MEPKKLEFYLKIIDDRQTMPLDDVAKKYGINRRAVAKICAKPKDDEPPMTDAERRRWLEEMNRRGF